MTPEQIAKLQQAQRLLSEVIDTPDYKTLEQDFHADITLGDALQGVSELLSYLSPSYPVPSFAEIFPKAAAMAEAERKAIAGE